jgi:hypothetical protein
MLRIVKWEFPVCSPAYMTSTDLVIGQNVIIGKLQSDKPQFSICGLGLTKAERVIFGGKRFRVRKVVNIYIGKLIISINRGGYKEHMKNVKITSDKPLFQGVR